VQFFLVYVREAHPTEGDRGDRQARTGPKIAQAKTADQRAIAASDCVRDLKLSIPVLLDDMDSTTEQAYRGWPARLVIIDIEGRVAYGNPSGPDGANPKNAPAVLDRLLANNGRMTPLAPATQPSRRD